MSTGRKTIRRDTTKRSQRSVYISDKIFIIAKKLELNISEICEDALFKAIIEDDRLEVKVK